MEKERKTIGSGLLIGIKDNIPFRETKIDLLDKDDEITESLSIEIPTKDKQKLRLTNLYITPIRNTAARQAGNVKQESRWINNHAKATTASWLMPIHTPLYGITRERKQIGE